MYIGKSISLRKRIQSHFYDSSTRQEKRLLTQIKRVEWIETTGELGALLKEARLIKTTFPIFNRRLRKYKTLFAIALIENVNNYHFLQVLDYGSLSISRLEICGLFRYKINAQETLKNIIKLNNLCMKKTNLDKSKGACFAYQVHRCLGACLQKEPFIQYNQRLYHALTDFFYKSWPFTGKIAVKEKCLLSNRAGYPILNRWSYLMTVPTLETFIHSLENTAIPLFDLDVYRILVRFLTEKREKLDSIALE